MIIMNEERRQKLRRIQKELEELIKQEDAAFESRPENLKCSSLALFHEDRFLDLRAAIEKLRSAIYDYEFRQEEERRELADALKKFSAKKKSRDSSI